MFLMALLWPAGMRVHVSKYVVFSHRASGRRERPEQSSVGCVVACGRVLLVVCSWGTTPTPTMTLVGQLRVDESHWWGVACGGWDSHCTVGSRAYVARTDTHQVGAAVTVYKDHCFRWDSRLMDGRHARQQTPMPMMTLVVESRVGESPSSSTPRSVLQQTAAGGRGSVLEGGRLLGLAAVWARR